MVLSILLLFLSVAVTAQDNVVGYNPPATGRLLNKGWKYQTGDNAAWVAPDYNDNHWHPTNPTWDIADIPPLWKTHIGWFRLRFTLDSAFASEPLTLLVQQAGASEIYLNGRLLQRYGRFGDNPKRVVAAHPPWNEFIGFPNPRPGEQVLAMRYAVQKNLAYTYFSFWPNHALLLRLMKQRDANDYLQANINYYVNYLHSLSDDIIKAHGGELKVDSTEGQGATFAIVLPLD